LRVAFLPSWWILFAAETLRAGHHPGFVMHPEQVPYPWGAVFTVWLILGVEVAVLHAILRPRLDQPWRRLGIAIVLVGGLAALSLFTLVTDMPGYYYVPGIFHFLTFIVLVTIAAVRSAARRLDRASA
jgi:hypothetical protein